MKSEFGKGLVICLTKFSEHFENEFISSLSLYKLWMGQTQKNRELMLSDKCPPNLDYGFPHRDRLKHFADSIDIWGSAEKTLSQRIEMWANGASDHLYDMEVPKGHGWKNIGGMVEKLKDKGLAMGHGSHNTIWTIEDVRELQELTRKIALEIDKKIGLKPQLGEW
jgi:hypothetical protein